MFLDELFRYPWVPCYSPPWSMYDPWQKKAAEMRLVLAHAQVFTISNVAEYLYVGRGTQGLNLWRDFPRPMPPFSLLWAEWKFPRLEKRGKSFVSLWLRDHLSTGLGCAVQTEPSSGKYKESSDTAWTVNFSPFVRSYGKNQIIMLPQVCFGIGADYNLVKMQEPKDVIVGFPRTSPTEDYSVDDDTVNEIIRMLDVPLLAMSLMNCRNVSLRTVKTPPALVRANIRRGHHATEAHHVIEIQPLLQHLRKETAEHSYGHKAAAIVRGHFKDYSERGLFGKYKGMFWWDQRLNSPTPREYRLKKSGGELAQEWGTP